MTVSLTSDSKVTVSLTSDSKGNDDDIWLW